MPHDYLKYPKKSHRKSVKTPNKSAELAEIFGIMVGDGSISSQFQFSISLNSESDALYSEYIIRQFKKHFDLTLGIFKAKDEKSLKLYGSSAGVKDFMLDNGLVFGNKVSLGVDIPGWVVGNPEYEKAFVRGLIDTDGCLFIHKHKVKGKVYSNIGLDFYSGSKNLVESVSKVLKASGIVPRITSEGRRIRVYRENHVRLYMMVFGSSNPRLLEKYALWRGVRVV